jgi:hypothetical protein
MYLIKIDCSKHRMHNKGGRINSISLNTSFISWSVITARFQRLEQVRRFADSRRNGRNEYGAGSAPRPC